MIGAFFVVTHKEIEYNEKERKTQVFSGNISDSTDIRRCRMAKLEKKVYGDFEGILSQIDRAVMRGSVSATFEDGSDYTSGNVF